MKDARFVAYARRSSDTEDQQALPIEQQLDDARARRRARILDPAAHRAAIEHHAVAREAILEPEQRQPVAVLLDHVVVPLARHAATRFAHVAASAMRATLRAYAGLNKTGLAHRIP